MNLETLTTYSILGSLFPLRPGTKQPFRGWAWPSQNTRDLDTLSNWLQCYPGANWGLLPAASILVLDLDCKPGKPSGHESITAAGIILPDTFRVRTPNNGTHLYYRTSGMTLTTNTLLPGVDTRGGDGKGYVVLPHSKVAGREYQPEGDPLYPLADLPKELKSLLLNQQKVGHGLTLNSPSEGAEEGHTGTQCTDTENVTLATRPDGYRWPGVRDRIRFLFFRRSSQRAGNVSIWNAQPTLEMRDRSQSALEFELVKRLAVLGATENEVIQAYSIWCYRNHLLLKMERFVRYVLPKAFAAVQPSIDEWRAQQPKRIPQGTTAKKVLDALQAGHSSPQAIVKACGLTIGQVKMTLKRLTDKGGVHKLAFGEYSLPLVPAPPKVTQTCSTKPVQTESSPVLCDGSLEGTKIAA